MIKALGKAIDREHRCTVPGHVERAYLAGYGGDVDDMPLAARNHGREHCMRAVNQAQVIGAHDGFDHLDGRFNEWLAHADPGIVDEYIDPAVCGEKLADHVANLLAVGDVAGHHRGSRADSPHLFLGLLETLPGAAAANDGGTFSCQINRQAPADAAGGAGDQYNLILEMHLGSNLFHRPNDDLSHMLS